MKKILTLAIFLLTLLPMTEVNAQGYSSETSNTACTSQSTGIWCRAMESNADIYTEVYQASYEFDDYSDHGNFSQDVVYQDGVCFHYNYDHNGSNYYTYRDRPYSYDDRERAYFYGSNSYGGYNSGYNNNNYYGSGGSYNSGSGVRYDAGSSTVSVGYQYTTIPNRNPTIDPEFVILNEDLKGYTYLPPEGVTMCCAIQMYYPYLQEKKYECVACAAATLADIMKVDGLSYVDVYSNISEYAGEELKINFSEKFLEGDCNFFSNILHDVAGLNVSNCGEVTSYINDGRAVLGIRDGADGIKYMVTIVGYDNNNYVCIDPGKMYPQMYPKNSFYKDFFYGYEK